MHKLKCMHLFQNGLNVGIADSPSTRLSTPLLDWNARCVGWSSFKNILMQQKYSHRNEKISEFWYKTPLLTKFRFIHAITSSFTEPRRVSLHNYCTIWILPLFAYGSATSSSLALKGSWNHCETFSQCRTRLGRPHHLKRAIVFTFSIRGKNTRSRRFMTLRRQQYSQQLRYTASWQCKGRVLRSGHLQETALLVAGVIGLQPESECSRSNVPNLKIFPAQHSGCQCCLTGGTPVLRWRFFSSGLKSR